MRLSVNGVLEVKKRFDLLRLNEYKEPMKRAFEIHFFNTKSGYELAETKFTSFSGEPLRCIRGKTPGAFRGAGSFQWTSAVRAISSLFIRHLISQQIQSVENQISGGHSSLASSLDYALSKAPRWLCEMFGTYQNGQITAKRLFLVTNPNQKRPGPVTIAINDSAIAPGDVRVMINGREAYDLNALLTLLNDVERMDQELPEEKACEAASIEVA
jgi:hypothetical protein